jgi:hypothetical protein
MNVRSRWAIGALLMISVVTMACASPGKRDWFGNPSPTPGCDLAGLPEPAGVTPLMPAPDQNGGTTSIMEISLQTRVLDNREYCEPGATAPTLGGLWDVGYNVTSDNLPFVGTGPNPYNGTTTDPHVWIFRVHHGGKNQVPPLVRVDFHAKFSDGVGQKSLGPHGAGAALILRINGGRVAQSIAYPMKGGDYLHIQLDPATLTVYFP